MKSNHLSIRIDVNFANLEKKEEFIIKITRSLLDESISEKEIARALGAAVASLAIAYPEQRTQLVMLAKDEIDQKFKDVGFEVNRKTVSEKGESTLGWPYFHFSHD